MHPRDISISDLTYDLPHERIAQQPLAERDGSKLLVYRNGSIDDHGFKKLPDLLPAESLLVMNNTRVVNARILFNRATGARIEVLCLEPADGSIEKAFGQTGNSIWKAMLGNARKWRTDETLFLKNEEFQLQADRLGHELVKFKWEPVDLSFSEVLQKIGHVPLPPYMARPDEALDRDRYNTVIAKHDGSIAAPTASLHFTEAMITELKHRKIRSTEITLHVGAGTFLQVKSDRMAGHEMHREQVRIPINALIAIHEQLGKAPIIPVGTTALRTLESIYWHGMKILRGIASDEMDIDQWEPYDRSDLPSAHEALSVVIEKLRNRGVESLSGSTRLLIAPGYQFRFTDALVTNFHQPQSTLLLLVAALVGPDWRKIYDHALNTGYRFLSYGDGSLLWKM
ncbi:MAG: S-adenosylmethionine:tRNA ribosyltransferase-isomerase [Bacteroidota bacterium]|nr:S-adenosylmethionine:tRNA ribosyltransferase-isomerase [Bacteroidota bacterium]